MADNTRRISLDGDDPRQESFEAADAVPVVGDDLDDEQSSRKPIDLDAPIESYFPEIPQVADPAPTQPVPPAVSAAAATDGTSPQATSAEAAALKTQLAETNDKYLRTLAEFQNYRRRMDDDIKRRIQEGNEKLIQQILPSLDDFDLAITAAQKTESYEQLIGGVEAMYRKLTDTLARQGIEPIPSVGEQFDATLHEAVMLDEESDQPDETVTAELRKGYTMNNRVIRPALVKVAKAGASPE